MNEFREYSLIKMNGKLMPISKREFERVKSELDHIENRINIINLEITLLEDKIESYRKYGPSCNTM